MSPSPVGTIEVGDPFPIATVESCDGVEVTLNDWPLLVLFYRGHWCGHCRHQLDTLARYASSFQTAGTHIVAISADEPEHCAAIQRQHDGRITVYRDPGAKLLQAIGLDDHDDAVAHRIARPATFVVDKLGIVRYRYVSRTPADRPMPDLLLLAVETLGRTTHRMNRVL
jgi:peroxiredoxin